MTDAQESRINISGFSKESVEMIREMESFGWVFRRSNHGVVGHAPNDKTTTSISRNLNKTNRSLRRAQADFKRWIRLAHPEMVEVATEYIDAREQIEESDIDPITADILKRGAVAKMATRINTMSDPMGRARLKRAVEDETLAQTAQTDESGEISVAAAKINKIEPMHFKKSKDGVERVLRRTWSTGRVDFACAFPECPVTSHNSRSVAQHYGAVHTRPSTSYTHTSAVTPESVDDGLPWEALAETVEKLRESEPESVEPIINLSPPDEHPVTKQMVDEQYNQTDAEYAADQTAGEIVIAIQRMVSAPLHKEIKRLGNQVDVLTKERDEAREHLAKIQSDWDALRSLLGGVNSD